MVVNYDHVSPRHLWSTRQIQWKTMRVGGVPMEYIEFGMTHTVDCPLDRRKWEIIPRGVQHESSVRVHRLVDYLCLSSYHQCLAAKFRPAVRCY